jgi:hypothetical protein
VLGAHQALGHRLGRHQEGASDLVRGQANERAQGQRDLRFDWQGWVAAGEDQPEPVVWDAAVVCVVRVVGETRDRGLPELRFAGRGPAHRIDGSVSRGRPEPGGRAGGDPIARPPLQRFGEGVLGALLGQIPIAGHADQIGDDSSPLRAERLGHRRLRSR